MKKSLFLAMAFLIGFGLNDVSAQFPIKIPKLKVEKPKTEQPKTEQPNADGNNPSTPNDSSRNQSQTMKSKDDVGFMPQPQPNSVPVLLKDTLEIRISGADRYWKLPNQRFTSSWIPLVDFDLFYDNSEKIRFTVEWLNPDGSLWFSESLDGTSTRYSEVFDTKSTNATGTYGFKIINTKTKEVVFQGKFKVNKLLTNPDDERYKNQFIFYVDNDWNLPFGYVGFKERSDWVKDPKPIVFMWFKGELKSDDFEARLFHNNQQITSTDDGGEINSGGTNEGRGADNCFRSMEICSYSMWEFSWKNFKVESLDKVYHQSHSGYIRDPNATYTKDKPGEYTVKIFHKGVQVRETKFTVDAKGWIAPNAFSKQILMTNYKVIVPVKITGNLDKWNPAAWKTDAFYGNPLTGFNVP